MSEWESTSLPSKRSKVQDPLFSITRAGEAPTEAQKRLYDDAMGQGSKRYIIRRLVPQTVGEKETLREAKELAEKVASKSPVSVAYGIWDRNLNKYTGVFVRDGEWTRHE